MWNFCPSLGAACFFTALFGLTTFTHLFQAIWYQKPYCWVITGSGTVQTVTYIFRVISILNPASFGDYAAWFVCILVCSREHRASGMTDDNIGCPPFHECICLYGYGTDGLELYQ